MQKIYIFFIISLLFVAGCGGGSVGTTGGSNNEAATYKVTLATEGTLAGSLAGIGVTLQLPTGVTPKLAADGSVDSSVVKASGVMANNASMVPPEYTPASGTTAGTLSFVLASTAAKGFGIGEFATVTLNVAPRVVNFATVNQNLADGTSLAVVKDYKVNTSSTVDMSYNTSVNNVSIKITAEAI